MSTPLDVVDIHVHLWPPAWGPGGARDRRAFALAPEIVARITDPDALVGDFAAGGLNTAVISATVESLFGATGDVDLTVLPEVNAWLAGLTQQHASILGFGVTDAFAGEAGAAIAEQAISELGLSGLVIDSSRDGRFLADPAARPTLEVAARHRVPVFVHPVAHPNAPVLIDAAGKWGNSAGRGLMNGIALLSVLNARILEELPDLHLIFATLGLGAIVQAGRGGAFGRDAAVGARPNVYFDTMGDDPRIVRALVGFFGAERVLAGTDWPILSGLSRERLATNLAAAGLSDEEQRLVAGGNARRLLALRQSAVTAAAAE